MPNCFFNMQLPCPADLLPALTATAGQAEVIASSRPILWTGLILLLGLFLSGLLLLIKGPACFRLWMVLIGAAAGFWLADNLLMVLPLLQPHALKLYLALPALGAVLLGLAFRLSVVAAGWFAGSLLAGSLLQGVAAPVWLLAGRLLCGLAGALLAHLMVKVFIRLAVAGGGAWLILTSGWRLFSFYLRPLITKLAGGPEAGATLLQADPSLPARGDVWGFLLPPADLPLWFWPTFFILALCGWMLHKKRRK